MRDLEFLGESDGVYSYWCAPGEWSVGWTVYATFEEFFFVDRLECGWRRKMVEFLASLGLDKVRLYNRFWRTVLVIREEEYYDDYRGF